MTRVLALDLSATKAGVATPAGALTTLRAPAVPSGDLDAHAARLAWWDVEVGLLLRSYTPDVVAIEDYFLRGPNRRTLATTAEVHGVAIRLLPAHGATFWSVPAEDVKAWATGDRRAGKDAMIAAALARGAELSITGNADDEADAFLLRGFVLEQLG